MTHDIIGSTTLNWYNFISFTIKFTYEQNVPIKVSNIQVNNIINMIILIVFELVVLLETLKITD